ncbi:hypothetical protein B0H10DRAFT_119891 [Mycena sp. CBHHK59/15]|nr:hypothetical protein B0H10DRAFT_119891 [Mycena sp. CBHHK59/15]
MNRAQTSRTYKCRSLETSVIFSRPTIMSNSAKSPFKPVRRVVTGHSPAGKSTVVADTVQPRRSGRPRVSVLYTIFAVPVNRPRSLTARSPTGNGWMRSCRTRSMLAKAVRYFVCLSSLLARFRQSTELFLSTTVWLRKAPSSLSLTTGNESH